MIPSIRPTWSARMISNKFGQVMEDGGQITNSLFAKFEFEAEERGGSVIECLT